MHTGEVEGEREDAAKTVSVKHTGNKCLRQTEKQIQQNVENIQYSHLLHPQLQESADIYQEAKHAKRV